MTKMKCYKVFQSGGAEVDTVMATCISKACQKYINTFERPAAWNYELYSRQQASIRYLLNYTVMSDFVILEA